MQWPIIVFADVYIHIYIYLCLQFCNYLKYLWIVRCARKMWKNVFENTCRNLIYIYGIHHWWILWSSYRKPALVGFESTTTELRSDALNDRAIRRRSTRTQSQLCTATPISSLVQCKVSFRLFSSSVVTFILMEIFLR